jgi:chitodextrinase
MELAVLGFPPPPDVEVPSTPGAPVAGDITSTSVGLSWEPAKDNVAVAGYELYQNGGKIAEPTSESFNVGGLEPETNYVFTVRAKDTSGNFSAMSDSVSVDTPAAEETE